MKIHVYTIARNEEYILPYFLRHYVTFADKIFVIDDHSTDRTAEIAKVHPKVEYLIYDYEKDENYDDHFSEYFTNIYKEHSRGNADWVIRVDVDELIYHTDLLSLLKKQKEKNAEVIKTNGYMMISKELPTCKGQIYDECKKGVRFKGYDKPIIFNPELDIIFTKGRHSIQNLVNIKIADIGILLLHYRYLSKEYFIRKSEHLYSRKGEMTAEIKKKMMEKGMIWYETHLKSENLIKVI